MTGEDRTRLSDKQIYVTANQINRPLDEAFASAQVGSERGVYSQALRNSNFDVWTYNDFFSNPDSMTETANQWIVVKNGTAPGVNVIKSNLQTPSNGKSTYSCELEILTVGTASASTEWSLKQSISSETAKFKNKPISLGFEVKGSVPGIVGVKLGTGGVNDTTTTVAVTTSWQTVKLENVVVGNITDLSLSIFLAGNTSNGFTSNFIPLSTGSIYIAQVQLNDGPLIMSYMPRMAAYEETLVDMVNGEADTVLLNRKGVQASNENLKFLESSNTLLLSGTEIVSGDIHVTGNVNIGANVNIDNNINATGIMKTYSGIEPALLTESQINAITTPALGFLVYDITNNLYKAWDGTRWTGIGGGGISTETNFDNLPQGTININSTKNVTVNPPYNVTDTWLVIVSQYGTKKIQVAFSYGYPGLNRTRSYNGSTWTAWSSSYAQWFEGVI